MHCDKDRADKWFGACESREFLEGSRRKGQDNDAGPTRQKRRAHKPSSSYRGIQPGRGNTAKRYGVCGRGVQGYDEGRFERSVFVGGYIFDEQERSDKSLPFI